MRFVKIISNWWSFHRISRSSARGHRPRPWPRLLHVPEALYPHFSSESAHLQWSWGHFHLLTLELGFTPAVTFEATGHYLRSPPSIPWEILRPVWVPSMSVAVDPIFLIPIQARGSGFWGPVTGESTPHCRWKFLECVDCCRASPGTAWDHRLRRLRLRRLCLRCDRGQELVSPKPKVGCQECGLVTVS